MKIEIRQRVERAGYVFSTDMRCFICGMSFKSTMCSHSVSDNDTAIRVAKEERLLK